MNVLIREIGTEFEGNRLVNTVCNVARVLKHAGEPLESFRALFWTQRTVHGYRAVRYDTPPGCAAGYMPELNVLCGVADFSTESEQPVTSHLVVEVTPSQSKGADR